MAITFKMDDEGNVTWDRAMRGEELTHQEATIMASVMTANRLGYVGDCIQRIAEAIEESRIDSAIEKVADQLEERPMLRGLEHASEMGARLKLAVADAKKKKSKPKKRGR